MFQYSRLNTLQYSKWGFFILSKPITIRYTKWNTIRYTNQIPSDIPIMYHQKYPEFCTILYKEKYPLQHTKWLYIPSYTSSYICIDVPYEVPIDIPSDLLNTVLSSIPCQIQSNFLEIYTFRYSYGIQSTFLSHIPMIYDQIYDQI